MESVVDRYLFDDYVILVSDRKLLYRGYPIRLQEVPFRMLLALVENPGQVVSRKELQSRMWDEQTFVDFDAGLRVAAGKLREALKDSAASPRYIETVTGRGYKFVGAVKASASEEQVLTPASIKTQVRTVPLEKESHPVLPRSQWQHLVWIAAGIAALLLGISGWMYARYRTLLQRGDILAIGVIENRTKDPAFDGTLSRALRVKLEESPYLHLKTSPGILVEHDLTKRLETCQSIGGKALVDGEIHPRANGYGLELFVYQCGTGKPLAHRSASADSQSGVLNALNQVAIQMRARLGEDTATLKGFDVPLSQATTDSLSALKSFSNGETKHLEGRDDDSLSDYKIATDLDPQFALAFARLGAIYANTGDHTQSDKYLRRAFELRGRTTDRERLYITAHYYSAVTGELDHLTETYRLWHSVYPEDPTPLNNLAAYQVAAGQSDESVRLAREAVSLDPTSNLFDATLTMALFRNGDYAAVTKLCADPSRNVSANFVFHESCFLTDVEQGDNAGQQEQLKWASGRPEEQGLFNDRAWIAVYSGQLRVAQALFQQNIETARRTGLPDVAAQASLDEALLLAEVGHSTDVLPLVANALALAPDDPSVQAFAALALARIGDDRRAAELVEKASAAAPLNTILQSAVLPTVVAARALKKQDSKSALTALEPVRRWDGCVAMQLQPGYYRGLAFEMAGDFDHAKLEFEQVVKRKHLAPRSLYVALSMLAMTKLPNGKIFEQTRAELRQTLKTLWATADKDLTPAQSIRPDSHASRP